MHKCNAQILNILHISSYICRPQFADGQKLMRELSATAVTEPIPRLAVIREPMKFVTSA
jgi:hypothetical protein